MRWRACRPMLGRMCDDNEHDDSSIGINNVFAECLLFVDENDIFFFIIIIIEINTLFTIILVFFRNVVVGIIITMIIYWKILSKIN